MTPKEYMLGIVIQSVRTPKKLHSFDLTTEQTAIRFSYEDKRFRVTVRGGFVEEVRPGILMSNDAAAKLQKAIGKVLTQ
jgi:hypothetical protein